MQKQAFEHRMLGPLYIDLLCELRKSGDLRQPEEVIALAVRTWLAERLGKPGGKGYQWKDLFLPDGTELRLRHKGVDYYAKVDGDKLMHAGASVSPSEWCNTVTGSVRNAWRDVWVRRSAIEYWTRAWDWRKDNASQPRLPFGERRQLHRRRDD